MKSFIKMLILLFLSVWLINTFIVVAYEVKGESMQPTLHNNDFLVVSIADYLFGDIERFDTAVIQIDDENVYVKRVIGMPGEKIEYKDDILFVNGEPIPENFLSEAKDGLLGDQWTSDFDIETLLGETTIPEGHYFVLGDNRWNSKDSREIGFIKEEQFIGKAVFRYYPINRIGKMQ